MEFMLSHINISAFRAKQHNLQKLTYNYRDSIFENCEENWVSSPDFKSKGFTKPDFLTREYCNQYDNHSHIINLVFRVIIQNTIKDPTWEKSSTKIWHFKTNNCSENQQIVIFWVCSGDVNMAVARTLIERGACIHTGCVKKGST